MRMPEYLDTYKRDGRALDETSDAVDEGTSLLFTVSDVALTTSFDSFSEHCKTQGAGTGGRAGVGRCCCL